MPKILKILQCSNLGGMEQSVYRLLPKLSEQDVRFSIATPRPFGAGEPILKEYDPAAADHVYQGKFGWKSHADFKQKLARKAEDTDRIWITGTDIASLRAVQGLKQPKLLGHHFHHFDSRSSFIKWKLFYEVFCKQCDKVSYCSDFVRNEAISIAPWLKSRSTVVRYHFPVVANSEEQKLQARSQLGIPQDALVMGNAGWLIPRKRWDVFLSVAEKVLESAPEAYFVLAGGGELEATLKERAKAMKHADRIRFLGWMSDLEPFYRSVDILLFNSDFDAFGRTPGEAMAHGAVPVVSLAVGGLGELVRDRQNGFFFGNHDVDGLAGRILELRGNPALMKELREAGEATLRNEFSVEQEVGFYINEFSR